MMELVKYCSRGDKGHKIMYGGDTIYFSYETVIAFTRRTNKGDDILAVSKNHWGTTTGRHINDAIKDAGLPTDVYVNKGEFELAFVNYWG